MESALLILKSVGEWLIDYSPIIILILVIIGFCYLHKFLREKAKKDIEVMTAIGNMVSGHLRDQIVLSTLKDLDVLDPTNRELIHYLRECISTENGRVHFIGYLKSKGYVEYKEPGNTEQVEKEQY